MTGPEGWRKQLQNEDADIVSEYCYYAFDTKSEYGARPRFKSISAAKENQKWQRKISDLYWHFIPAP